MRLKLRGMIAEAHAVGESASVSVEDRLIEVMTGNFPPATIEEFEDDLNLPYGTIRENLMKLADKGIVSIGTRPRSEGANGLRGGSRKPELVFTLA